MAGVQGVLFTSANGVRAFADVMAPPPGVPAYVVGPATAKAARATGWRDVEIAGGNVEALALLVAETASPEAGTLLHISGKAAAGDLVGALAQHGFEARRVIAYDAAKTERMPESALAAFLEGTIDAVLLFSPRSARTYLDALEGAGLLDKARGVKAFCLSHAVAHVLQGHIEAPLVVAPEPQTTHLLALLSP